MDKKVKRAKRKNGEGSYSEVTIKGIIYKRYRDAEIGTVYAKTATELQKKIQYKREHVEDSIIDKALKLSNLTTFSELCDEWLPTVYNEVSTRTYDDYEAIIRSRIKGFNQYDLAYRQIKSIDANTINRYLVACSMKYSSATIHKTLIVIKMILKYAVKCKYISQDFKFDEIKEPRPDKVAVPKRDIKAITIEDMDLLYEELCNPIYGVSAKMMIFIMYSGLRISEAAALRWGQVGKDLKSVYINAATSRVVVRDKKLNPVVGENGRVKHELIRKGPKSRDSRRTIPLPSRAIKVLEELRETGKCSDEDYVFSTKSGNPVGTDNARRCLKSALKRSKCSYKDYTPHELRHGYGSVLISNGKDIKLVSELLGHSSVSFTYDVYIDILEKDKANAVRDVFG